MLYYRTYWYNTIQLGGGDNIWKSYFSRAHLSGARTHQNKPLCKKNFFDSFRKKPHPMHLKVHPSNRGFEKKTFFPWGKSYFSFHQSTGFCFLIPKRYDTYGLLYCNPLLLKTPLISLRWFLGKGGCRLVTPKCHTFLESGSKILLIGEEKNMIILKEKKFFFKSPIWRLHLQEHGLVFFSGSYQKNSFCKVYYIGEF